MKPHYLKQEVLRTSLSEYKRLLTTETLFSKNKNVLVTETLLSEEYSQLAFTCSKLTIETLERDVKYVQS